MSTALALRHISKRFGDVVALDDATLEIRSGEVHALLGENGAGKTSLMNVVAGLYQPDAGSIELNGRRVHIDSPATAKRLGIGMLHQEQRLVERFTAPENIILGAAQPRWLVRRVSLRRLACAASDRFGLEIDADTPIWALPLGRRQRVEIVKLLHQGARLIVLDEPTANIAPAEVETFFAAVRRLSASGHTVVLITHLLDEVLRYTDRVTVMRAGRTVATFASRETTRQALNRLMLGADEAAAVAGAPSPGSAVLVVRDLTIPGSLHAVDLHVRAGEVVAVAGVAGNGQTALAEAVTGHIQHYAGVVEIAGHDIRGLGARHVAELGVGYVPENRREVGLVGGQSVAINLALRAYARPPFSRHGWLDYAAMRRAALDLIQRYGIQPPDPDVPVARLSGGNQQRVIVARELSGTPGLIVADNFTRGLDPRSAQQFTSELFAHRDRGAAVLWITSDLASALLCDRVAIMNRGRVVAVLSRAEATPERVGLLMSGDVAAPRG